MASGGVLVLKLVLVASGEVLVLKLVVVASGEVLVLELVVVASGGVLLLMKLPGTRAAPTDLSWRLVVPPCVSASKEQNTA